MIYNFGKKSKKKLSQASNDLQNAARLALEWGVMDFAVIEGHRGSAEQKRLYVIGKSRVLYPDSKHNKKPSDALDIVPVINGKISWKRVHCIHLAGIIIAAGRCLGTRIRWGGNWDLDGEPITDQDFQDLVHYETKGKI
jgi:peptidoglycan LD-endopeptidase CwlK